MTEDELNGKAVV